MGRFAEQGAYTAGQTTPPVPKSRRRLPVKAIDLKDALSKAENLVGALKRLKTPTKRGRVPPPPPKQKAFKDMTTSELLTCIKTMTAAQLDGLKWTQLKKLAGRMPKVEAELLKNKGTTVHRNKKDYVDFVFHNNLAFG